MVTLFKMYNVKPLESSYISRQDNKNNLSDFRLMKIAQSLCPELHLLQINIRSYISVSLHCSRGNTPLFTQTQSQCHITENTHIVLWFTVASLELTTGTESGDPQIAGISVPVESGTNSGARSCQKAEENFHQTDD